MASRQVVIENPVINSPFDEPRRHFRFSDEDILECTGQKKKDKEAKVTTAQTLWIPAVNGHGEFGRRDFLEVRDPWDAQNEIRAFLTGKKQP